MKTGFSLLGRPAIEGLLICALLSACSLAPRVRSPPNPGSHHLQGGWRRRPRAGRYPVPRRLVERLRRPQAQRAGNPTPRRQPGSSRRRRALRTGTRTVDRRTLESLPHRGRERLRPPRPQLRQRAADQPASRRATISSRHSISRGKSISSAGCATPRLRPVIARRRAPPISRPCELALRAELATDYFSLRGADANLQLLEDTVKAYDRAYELTKNRYDGGIAAATDVDQAETQRQNARSQLAAVRLERAQLEHAIAVLLGQLPSLFKLDAASLASNPPPIDTGLPSALLLRRPDVASAERAVAAANAEIGVARAAWFPVFTLGGTGGYESTQSSTWFDAPSRFWAAGPAAALPLLDVGGRSALNKQCARVLRRSRRELSQDRARRLSGSRRQPCRAPPSCG